MRDIRADLRERLSKIETEREVVKARLEVLSQQEKAVLALIDQENMLWPSPQSSLFEQPMENGSGKERTGLGSLLMRALAGGIPRTLSELKRVAEEEGFDFGDKQPGRVMHFALLGMAQNGQVEMLGKGLWKLKASIGQQPDIAPKTKPEQLKANGAISGSGPKDLIEDFIRKNGPSSRQEIMRGSSAPGGSISYGLKDPRFCQLPDGKWDLVNGMG